MMTLAQETLLDSLRFAHDAEPQPPWSDTVLARADAIAPTYRRPSRLFVQGRGAELQDAEGRRYLDMTSGIGVLALGHRSPVVTRALRRAASGLVHVSNLFHTAPPIELAAALVERSFADRVFFCNSGAEAVEGALKFARLAAGPERYTVVSFAGSFHGRTFGALSATDRPAQQQPFEPLAGGFRSVAWNDEAALAAIDATTAAVIVEPIQGEGGIRVPSSGWLQALRRRCDQLGALLIFDEVQCGLGRTGQLWAHQHFGVEPDLMTLAKPLAGGLPMGAVLMTERVASAISPGCHATTFGGGPLVSSVAREVLETVSAPAFLQRVRERGRLLRRLLEKLPEPPVREIRGQGLFVGVRLAVPPARVVSAALEQGLLLVAAGDDVVRLLPPLDVRAHELERAVTLLERALRVAMEASA